MTDAFKIVAALNALFYADDAPREAGGFGMLALCSTSYLSLLEAEAARERAETAARAAGKNWRRRKREGVKARRIALDRHYAEHGYPSDQRSTGGISHATNIWWTKEANRP